MSNPDGKGGFGDRPEDINKDGRPEWTATFGTIYNKLLAMTPEELADYQPKTGKEALCKKVVLEKEDYKEIADRVYGKAKQTVEQNTNITTTQPIKIEFED